MPPNVIVALGTDPVGYHGLRVDISRTCWIGPGTASTRPDMVAAMRHAREHIIKHMALYGPGVPLRDLTVRGHQLEPGYDRQTSACRIHGVRLCGEWAQIDYADTYHVGAFDTVLAAGVLLCVEALMGEHGGDFCIKPEDQVQVTDGGYETLSWYPFDATLMG